MVVTVCHLIQPILFKHDKEGIFPWQQPCQLLLEMVQGHYTLLSRLHKTLLEIAKASSCQAFLLSMPAINGISATMSFLRLSNPERNPIEPFKLESPKTQSGLHSPKDKYIHIINRTQPSFRPCIFVLILNCYPSQSNPNDTQFLQTDFRSQKIERAHLCVRLDKMHGVGQDSV